VNKMICPTCRTWTQVLETRQRPDNSAYRRYECANGHRFTTNEQVILKVKRKVANAKA